MSRPVKRTSAGYATASSSMPKMRVELQGMPGWEPMEQREKSRTCSGFSESSQRKAKPKLAIAHLGGEINLQSFDLLFALLEQPVAYGGNLIAIVE